MYKQLNIHSSQIIVDEYLPDLREHFKKLVSSHYPTKILRFEQFVKSKIPVNTTRFQSSIRNKESTLVLSHNSIFFTSIDEIVYWLKNGSLWEHYQIKDSKISNPIPNWDDKSSIWKAELLSNTLERRSKFHQILFQILVFYVNKEIQNLLDVTNDPKEFTEVTGHGTGIYDDYLQSFEKRLNFSTLQNKRLDCKWGSYDKLNKTESKFSPISRAKKLFKFCKTTPILPCFCQSYSIFN